MNLDRRLGLAAALLLLAGTGGAVLAHPHPEGEDEGKQVKRFVIIEDGNGGSHDSKGERVRRFEIIRDGEHHAGRDGPRVRRFEMHGPGALVRCEGGDKVVEESSDEDGRKTKVVCSKGGPTAETAERIEEALARIRSNGELSAEQKARIETALRSAMERARSAR